MEVLEILHSYLYSISLQNNIQNKDLNCISIYCQQNENIPRKYSAYIELKYCRQHVENPPRVYCMYRIKILPPTRREFPASILHVQNANIATNTSRIPREYIACIELKYYHQHVENPPRVYCMYRIKILPLTCRESPASILHVQNANIATNTARIPREYIACIELKYCHQHVENPPRVYCMYRIKILPPTRRESKQLVALGKAAKLRRPLSSQKS